VAVATTAIAAASIEWRGDLPLPGIGITESCLKTTRSSQRRQFHNMGHANRAKKGIYEPTTATGTCFHGLPDAAVSTTCRKLREVATSAASGSMNTVHLILNKDSAQATEN
jgi:hypothetical protein